MPDANADTLADAIQTRQPPNLTRAQRRALAMQRKAGSRESNRAKLRRLSGEAGLANLSIMRDVLESPGSDVALSERIAAQRVFQQAAFDESVELEVTQEVLLMALAAETAEWFDPQDGAAFLTGVERRIKDMLAEGQA